MGSSTTKQMRHQITNYFENAKISFGDGEFYQTLGHIVPNGQRPTEERIDTYKILSVINKNTSILDIGSNCGFMSVTLAEYAHHVVGIEPSKELINISNIAKSVVGCSNCDFKCVKFSDFKSRNKYDLVLSLAVHNWVEMPFQSYINKIIETTSENAHLLIESHNLKSVDSNFNDKKRYLLDNFKLINSGNIVDDRKFNIEREFLLLKI